MISKYRVRQTNKVNSDEFGYIERVDNYLCIAYGQIISYMEYLEKTDWERNPDYRIISMYQGEDGSIILLVADDVLKNQYITVQPV